MIPVSPVLMAPSAEVSSQQAGALCWRMHRAQVQVLLITSRDTGRWVIPKGWPIRGLSLGETAAREAWEEAGVEGRVQAGDLGVFHYLKAMVPEAAIPCQVRVYGLRVIKLKHRYPERGQRHRKWFTLKKAARLVAEPELRDLLHGLGANPAFAALASA